MITNHHTRTRRPRLRRALRATIVVLSLAHSLAAQDPSRFRGLPYSRIVLPNGLVVLLSESHSSPIVAVDVWFRFGSRDDSTGRLGVAHLCEHVFSEGSAHLSTPQPVFYRSLGGVSTRMALTTEDVTHYFVTVPRDQLERVLWAEADRLSSPMAMADSTHLAAVRRVLTQEYRQARAAQAFATARDVVERHLFGEGHPYYMSGVSPLEDIDRVTPVRLSNDCRPFYVPNNAVLSISGDFKTTDVKALVNRYFGQIPRGAVPRRRSVPPPGIQGGQRLVLEDSRATQPVLQLDWVGAAYRDRDRIALLALASSLSLARFGLDGQFTAFGVEPPQYGRLAKLLVQDRQLATRVIADNIDMEEGGVFEIQVRPRPGVSLTLIETLVDSVLADLRQTTISAEELASFNEYNDVQVVSSLQLAYMRADTLAHDEIFAGDPSAYLKQLHSARALTPTIVAEAMRRFLTANRITLSLIPAGRLDLVSRPELPYDNVTQSSPPTGRP